MKKIQVNREKLRGGRKETCKGGFAQRPGLLAGPLVKKTQMPARALQIRAGISPTCTAVEKASYTIKQKEKASKAKSRGTHNAELSMGQPLERDRHQRKRCNGHEDPEP